MQVSRIPTEHAECQKIELSNFKFFAMYYILMTGLTVIYIYFTFRRRKSLVLGDVCLLK